MRAGTWSGAVSTENARVTVAGVVVPSHRIRKVEIQSGMRDGHPAADTGASWCVEATIEWATPEDVTASAPEPFTGTSWLPRAGDSVVIESGDAATGQWWVQHRGIVDDTKGSLEDGTAVTTTVDDIEELDSRVSFAALAARMVPATDVATSYREIGLQSTFLVDRMLRQAQNESGWYATPPKTWQTLMSAPGMGSLWPEVGQITSASKIGDAFSGPAGLRTSYGMAPTGYTATYNLTSATDEVIVSCALLPVPGVTGTSSIQVVDSDGAGCWIGMDHGTDEILYGSITAGGPTYRLARAGATRASVRFKRLSSSSQSLILRTSDGREVSQDPGASGYPTGWAADRVHVLSRASFGWIIVEGAKTAAQRWSTLDSTPTARVRVGDIQWWKAYPDLPWVNPSEWLAEQVDAECASMWLDEDGVMQWAGRGVLDSQSVAQTVTTDLDVDAVAWESRRRSMARGVWVQLEDPSVRRLLGGPRQNCWDTDNIDLGPGESETVTVTIPDDEDWLGIDLAPVVLTQWTQESWLRSGSKFGGTQYQESSSGAPGQTWALYVDCTMTRRGLRNIDVFYAPWSNLAANQRVKSAIPDLNADNAPASSLASWHAGRAALRIRSRGITTWVEDERSLVAGTIGPSRYNHDVGRRVQRVSDANDPVGDLLSWLRTVVSSTNPTVTGLVLSHDPRRQVGDKVRVQDRHVTGLWFDVIVQQRTADLADMTDTITGRVTAWGSVPGLSLQHPAGPTALTPPDEHEPRGGLTGRD